MRDCWPEVSWEQRGKLPSDVVYEAEVCFRTEAETQERISENDTALTTPGTYTLKIWVRASSVFLNPVT